MRKALLIALTPLVLVGCTSTNCFQEVASTRTAIITAADTTASMLENEVINKNEAEKARIAFKGAWLLANNAAPMCSVDEASAKDYLVQAGNLLSDVNNEIIKGD